ncbi:hypothetical protein Tco_1164641 [Tanacetum coccineum]|uniref:Uncharacterized protein n=1 Tax=Tanacetum coccineum TaxID=301880 RepID=A0ABQ5GMC8_9ASTR
MDLCLGYQKSFQAIALFSVSLLTLMSEVFFLGSNLLNGIHDWKLVIFLKYAISCCGVTLEVHLGEFHLFGLRIMDQVLRSGIENEEMSPRDRSMSALKTVRNWFISIAIKA